jgi:hypothetical protein
VTRSGGALWSAACVFPSQFLKQKEGKLLLSLLLLLLLFVVVASG